MESARLHELIHKYSLLYPDQQVESFIVNIILILGGIRLGYLETLDNSDCFIHKTYTRRV